MKTVRNKNLFGRNPIIPTPPEKQDYTKNSLNQKFLLEKTVIDSRGRIVIPTSIRKKISLHPGDAVYLVSNGGELRILKEKNLEQILQRNSSLTRR